MREAAQAVADVGAVRRGAAGALAVPRRSRDAARRARVRHASPAGRPEGARRGVERRRDRGLPPLAGGAPRPDRDRRAIGAPRPSSRSSSAPRGAPRFADDLLALWRAYVDAGLAFDALSLFGQLGPIQVPAMLEVLERRRRRRIEAGPVHRGAEARLHRRARPRGRDPTRGRGAAARRRLTRDLGGARPLRARGHRATGRSRGDLDAAGLGPEDAAGLAARADHAPSERGPRRDLARRARRAPRLGEGAAGARAGGHGRRCRDSPVRSRRVRYRRTRRSGCVTPVSEPRAAQSSERVLAPISSAPSGATQRHLRFARVRSLTLAARGRS